jgi:hypothetical protein
MNWRPVVGYEGRYEVSDAGEVKSYVGRLKSSNLAGRIVTPCISRGYPKVDLAMNGKKRPFTVHRLVMAAFVGVRPAGFQINHKNGIKTDNRLENLEYCSTAANRQHAYDTGLQPKRKGEKHPLAKLTAELVMEIRRRRSNGERPKDLAREMGIHQSNICHIVSGRIWGHLPIAGRVVTSHS